MATNDLGLEYKHNTDSALGKTSMGLLEYVLLTHVLYIYAYNNVLMISDIDFGLFHFVTVQL